MKLLAVSICMAIFLAGCGAPTEVAPRTGFAMAGATVASPNEPGWLSVGSNPGKVQLGKKGELQGETKFVYVMAIQADASQSDSAFLSMAKNAKINDANSSRNVSLKNRTRNVTFKQARCLTYESLMQDTKSNASASGPQYVNTIGYTCRHPLRKDLAIDMAYSKRSTNRELSKSERGVARQFFADVRFHDNLF